LPKTVKLSPVFVLYNIYFRAWQRLLSCLHTICLDCCKNKCPIADKSLKCPVCSVDTELKFGEASLLPKNYALRKLNRVRYIYNSTLRNDYACVCQIAILWLTLGWIFCFKPNKNQYYSFILLLLLLPQSEEIFSEKKCGHGTATYICAECAEFVCDKCTNHAAHRKINISHADAQTIVQEISLYAEKKLEVCLKKCLLVLTKKKILTQKQLKWCCCLSVPFICRTLLKCAHLVRRLFQTCMN